MELLEQFFPVKIIIHIISFITISFESNNNYDSGTNVYRNNLYELFFQKEINYITIKISGLNWNTYIDIPNKHKFNPCRICYVSDEKIVIMGVHSKKQKYLFIEYNINGHVKYLIIKNKLNKFNYYNGKIFANQDDGLIQYNFNGSLEKYSIYHDYKTVIDHGDNLYTISIGNNGICIEQFRQNIHYKKWEIKCKSYYYGPKYDNCHIIQIYDNIHHMLYFGDTIYTIPVSMDGGSSFSLFFK